MSFHVSFSSALYLVFGGKGVNSSISLIFHVAPLIPEFLTSLLIVHPALRVHIIGFWFWTHH